MTLLEAISVRHSVRSYTDRPLDAAAIDTLRVAIAEANSAGNLHMQLILDEPRAFTGLLAYGKFKGVRNYIAVVAPKGDRGSFAAGYWGEELVLLAQTLGLNTCWVGLSYRKIRDTVAIAPGERIAAYIAIGYGSDPGKTHRIKTPEQVSNVAPDSPQWFKDGVNAALLAPTAINQQKFHFDLQTDGSVNASPGHSLVGYTHIDLGIACRHFDIASGKDFFGSWGKNG